MVIINQSTSASRIPAKPQTPTRTRMSVFYILCELIYVLIKVKLIIFRSFYRMFVPLPEKSVKGEIVLITGGGNGIGREMAIQYASHGSTVICWDVDKPGMEETVKKIQDLDYPKAYSYVCDISNREEVLQMAERVQNEIGHVSILVNNAGILACYPLLSYTEKKIKDTININLMGHFWTLQAFLPNMIKTNHGHVLAIASLAGVEAIPNTCPYSASKFGVRGLMEGLLKELNCNTKNQVKLTTIYPYMVGTTLLKTPSIRFPKLFPIVSPRYIAKVAIKAQRRGVIETGAPPFYVITANILKLLPVEAKNLLCDFLQCDLDSEL